MHEDPRNAHIPLIIYSPNIITTPKIINTITSQVDVVPSLLHLIGYPLPFDLMGKNILSDYNDGFACRIINDYAIWIEPNFIYTEIFNQTSNAFRYSDLYNHPYTSISNDSKAFQSIQHNFHAYLQTAYIYYKKR